MSGATEDKSLLSDALQEKAKNELGEKLEWRKRDIEALRDLIKSDKGAWAWIIYNGTNSSSFIGTAFY